MIPPLQISPLNVAIPVPANGRCFAALTSLEVN